MRRLPPLNAIRFFEVAARHESFVRAATELHVTHGAVSRQIALLEDWLGVLLFRRTARQVSLTEAGRTLLKEAGAALDRLELAATLLRQSNKLVTLTVSATPTFSMHWLIPRLSSFTRRCPDIQIRLTSSLDPVDFSRDSYDVAIRRLSSKSSEHRVSLFPAILMPICSPQLLGTTQTDVADLTSHTLIHTATSAASWPNWLESVGQKDLQSGGTLYFDQLYFGVQACINRMGFTIAPAVVLIDDIISGRLALPFPRLPLPDDTIYHATTSGGNGLDDAVREFVEWLQEEGKASYELTRDLTQ